MPESPATLKQMEYIKTLIDSRKVPEEVLMLAEPPLSKSDASKVIDQLKMYPWRETENETRTNGNYNSYIIEGENPTPGTYTVELETERRTLRIRKPHPKANFLVAEYLFGPDNSNDFKRFAREWEDHGNKGFKLIPGYDMGGILIACLRALMTSDKDKLAEMGFKYALQSGNCYRCGRKLTVPASIHRGLGPVCAGKEE